MKPLTPWIVPFLLVLAPLAPATATETLPTPAEASASPLATPGTPAATDRGEAGVVARVNGEPVYLEDLERQLKSLHEQVVPGERPDFDIERLVERLVNDTLLAQEARSLGLAEEDSVAEPVDDLRHDLAQRRLEREEVLDVVSPTEDEVRERFEENYRRATLRVLTTYEKAEAEAALERLRAGADFAELVAEVSVDPYKLRGGLVEDIARVDLQAEISEVVFVAEPGDLLGPIRTSIGWSVARLESFQAADPERWEALRKSVSEALRFQRTRTRKQELTRTLREKHPVEVQAEVLASLVAERQPDGRLLPRVPEPEAVLATVGSQRLTAADLQQALAWRWKGIRNEEAARAAVPLVLEDLVEERLMLAEALARGYHRTPEVERSAAALEKSLLVEHYLEEVLAPQVEIDGEALEAYYREHEQGFHRPPRVHVSQVTVETEEEAARLVEQVRAGTDFAWLARRHSIDRFKEVGGERGWMYPMPDTDELSALLLAAKVGDVLGPAGVPGNWVVLRVNVVEEQGAYPFREVSGNVRSALFQERFGALIGKAVETLRSRSEIEVDAAALDALAVSGSREMAADGHAGGH